MRNHHPFTMMELVFVVTLIGLVASLVSFAGGGALRRHRFEGNVTSLASQLQLAQEVALCCNVATTVTLEPSDDQSYHVTLSCEGKVPEGFDQAILRPTHLTSLGEVLWKGQRPPHQWKFDVAGEGRYPQGTLILYPHSSSRRRNPLPKGEKLWQIDFLGHFAKLTPQALIPKGPSPEVTSPGLTSPGLTNPGVTNPELPNLRTTPGKIRPPHAPPYPSL